MTVNTLQTVDRPVFLNAGVTYERDDAGYKTTRQSATGERSATRPVRGKTIVLRKQSINRFDFKRSVYNCIEIWIILKKKNSFFFWKKS